MAANITQANLFPLADLADLTNLYKNCATAQHAAGVSVLTAGWVWRRQMAARGSGVSCRNAAQLDKVVHYPR